MAKKVWFALLFLTVASLIATVVVRPTMLNNYTRYPVALLIPLIVAAGAIGYFVFVYRRFRGKVTMVAGDGH